jgi:hypothetical protein
VFHGGPSNYEDTKDILQSDSPHARLLLEAKDMSNILSENQPVDLMKGDLIDKLYSITQELEKIWRGVQSGSISVTSKALLLTIKSITCPDIARKLGAECPDCERIMRDIRLLINTFEHVLKPEQIF